MLVFVLRGKMCTFTATEIEMLNWWMRDKDTECIIEKGKTRRMYAIEPKKREKK